MLARSRRRRCRVRTRYRTSRRELAQHRQPPSSRTEVGAERIIDRLRQRRQSAVEEMADARQQHDARRRRERRAPLEHGTRRARRRQPRRARAATGTSARRSPPRNLSTGGATVTSPAGATRAAIAPRRRRRTRSRRDRDAGPASARGTTRRRRAHPRAHRRRPRSGLGDAPDAAKIEPHGIRAEARERASERRHDLVAHRALLERMRVADDGGRHGGYGAGVDRGLEPAGGTWDLDARRLPRRRAPLSLTRRSAGRARPEAR